MHRKKIMIDISKIILYIEVTIIEQFKRIIWRMEMKKLTVFAVAALYLFVMSACISSRPVYKANIITEEFPEETEIILTTPSPVKYKVTELESFPGIILSFPRWDKRRLEYDHFAEEDKLLV